MSAVLIVMIGTYSAWVGVTIALRLSFGGKNERHFYTAFTLLITLIFVTSTFNPVLYCLGLGEICAAVKRIFLKQNHRGEDRLARLDRHQSYSVN